MNSKNEQISPVLEFFITANEYCKLLEFSNHANKLSFISKIQKILSFVYLKASLLVKPDELEDGELEKFVQEEDWEYIKTSVAKILGSSDRYIEIILPENLDPENYENVSLSECFADIYQDLKEFVTTYEIGNQQSIQLALFECLLNFEKFWGPRLLSGLSYLHNLLYSSELYDEDELKDNDQNNQEIDTSNWLINQRFNE
ncbi:MAG: DUF5063 domain-containing protein [Bacteroidales bacterium]|nr:DUF5063 domain-containing protein [Bacteroidales bacterium]